MKKQNGISMIALVVTIVVIIILASIVTMNGIESVQEARKSNIDMEIRNIKDAVQERITKNEQNPSRYPLVGQRIDDPTDYIYYVDTMSNSEIEDFVSNLSDVNYNYFRLVDAGAAETLGAGSIDETHYYVVDYYSGGVWGPVNMTEYNSEATFN